MNEPNAYDIRAELRQHIALWRDGKLGGDQVPERATWVIACFTKALEELDSESRGE